MVIKYITAAAVNFVIINTAQQQTANELNRAKRTQCLQAIKNL
jgi:hypothetical protein